MRFVAVKTEVQRAAALVFRTRDLAVKQHTQRGNALRGHLAEAARPMFAMIIDASQAGQMAASDYVS